MCALVVNTADLPYKVLFTDPLVSALSKICPGAKLVGDTVDLADVDCAGYCVHRAGCNLLQALVSCTETITISWGSPEYWNLSRVDRPGTVFFQSGGLPEDCCSDCDKDSSWAEMELEAILAHELIHAWHDCSLGTHEETTPEELCTVCAENQVRREMKLPERCRYFDIPVDCAMTSLNALSPYTCYLLPQGVLKAGCTCKPSVWKWLLDLIAEIFRRILPWPPRPPEPPPVPRPPGHPVSLQRRSPEMDDQSSVAEPTFGDMTPRDPEAGGALGDALRMLAMGRRIWGNPELERRFEASSDALILEIVLLTSGYRVLLLTFDGDSPEFWTNIRLMPGAPAPTLGKRRDLTPREIPPGLAPEIRSQFGALAGAAAQTPEGASVERGISDGDAHFLRIKTEADGVRRFVLRGFNFVPWDPKRGRPRDEEDGSRWDLMREARDFGAELIEASHDG